MTMPLTHPGILFAAALAIAGCQDYEQRARAIGTEARSVVARACGASAGADAGPGADAGVKGDAGDVGDDDGACTHERCRTECERPEVPRGFAAACLDTCRQTGICATNADCGAGKECVAIAPVVRRCVARATQ